MDLTCEMSEDRFFLKKLKQNRKRGPNKQTNKKHIATSNVTCAYF